MSMSVGGSSGNAASTTQIPDWLKSDWENVNAQAQHAAQSGTPQQQVAGFTPVQLQGQQASIDNAQPGLASVNQAAAAAGGLLGYQAPTVDLSKISAGVNHYSAHDAAKTDFNAKDLAQFENPYTKDVINTSVNQLDLARQQAINGNSSNATLQGGESAFGGGRAGVSDALTNTGFANSAASMIAGLNDQNFQTALGADQTYDQMGQAINLANQNAENTKEQFNAGADNAASIFNAQQSLAGQEANAGYSLAGEAARAQAAGLLGSLGGAQQAAGANAANAILNVGQSQQGLAQNILNANYQNQQSSLLQPLQIAESPFGIVPTTSNGSSTTSHSSGKSGQAGVG